MRGPKVGIAAVLICWVGGPLVVRQAIDQVAAGNVSDAQLVQAESQPANWLTYGRTYSEQRFSPLRAINDHNMGQLGLAWHFDLDTHRGQEATPIVVDGAMYFSTAWSKVYAL